MHTLYYKDICNFKKLITIHMREANKKCCKKNSVNKIVVYEKLENR